MAYNTVIEQGSFTSNGQNTNLSIRSGFDWIKVYNLTAAAQGAADLGYEFYWQNGMTNGRGMVWTKLGTVANDPVTVGQIAANSGFFLFDNSLGSASIGPAIAETAITNATQPVVSTGNTGSLVTGSVVRLADDTNLPNLMGFDFEVDAIIANVSFRMRYVLANAPGAAGAGNGVYRQVNFDPIFYPRNRYIIDVNAISPVITRVTLSVTHQYQVGQEVRFIVPDEFSMTELNGLQGTITAISTAANTIDVNIDATGFTAFTFPAVADFPFNWAQVVPIGEDTSQALISGVDILTDATVNQAFIGVTLIAGNFSPAGNNNDVIFWVAGKSFS